MTTEDQTWWRTSIVNHTEGSITIRGRPLETLIGEYSVADLLWLLVIGSEPEPDRSRLLEAVMVAGATFGPRSPSIAIGRMVATCGVPYNGVLAAAVNALGDIHGGAIEQAGGELDALLGVGDADRDAAITEHARRARADRRFVPGFGHRFLTSDPRATRLLALVDEAAETSGIDPRPAAIARSLSSALTTQAGRPIPVNIDGASAAVLLATGFPVSIYRGVFCLSRSVGIVAEAYEELGQGGRLKGPSHPRDNAVLYEGPWPPGTGTSWPGAGPARPEEATPW